MKIVLFVITAFLILNITACDDCINCTPGSFCNFDKLREKVADSGCLAEDFIAGFGCPNIFCSSNDPDIRIGNRETCTVIDCQTLSCEDLRIETFNPETSILTEVSAAGLVTDISVDETGLPTGFFEVDDLVGELSCVLVSP